MGVTEGVGEAVDGVALEAEADVGVHRRGHAYVSMTQQLLDDDEFDALFEEEGGGRVAEIMEPDASERGPAEQGVEVPGECGPFDRVAVGSGEDVAARLPARPCRFAFLALPFAVPFEGAQARRRQGDTAFGALGLGGRAVRRPELVR